MAHFYLLDLERTIGLGKPYFWKRSRYGYTDSLSVAGLFSKMEADKLVELDLDKKTIMINQDLVRDILGEDLKHREGTAT